MPKYNLYDYNFFCPYHGWIKICDAVEYIIGYICPKCIKEDGRKIPLRIRPHNHEYRLSKSSTKDSQPKE
jgi:hypothetical protein